MKIFALFFLLAHSLILHAEPLTIYRGTIDKFFVMLRLTQEGNTLSGSYVYEKYNRPITLKGTIDDKKQFRLEEFDEEGNSTGIFLGAIEMVSETPGQSETLLKGTWQAGDKKPTLLFYAKALPFSAKNLQLNPKVFQKKSNDVAIYYFNLVGDAPGVTTFNKMMNELIDELKANINKNTGYFFLNYTIAYANDQFISVALGGGGYAEGNAHPGAINYSINVDLKNNRVFEMSDVFKKDISNAELYAIYDKTFKKSYFDEDENSLKNYYQHATVWTLSPQGLRIHFDVPHVIEALADLFIPLDDIKTLLNPDGPVRYVEQGKSVDTQ